MSGVSKPHMDQVFEAFDSWERTQVCIRGHVRVVREEVERLVEQLEAAQTAMRRARHELDQWVFADGSASYRVERAEAILDAVLNPATSSEPPDSQRSRLDVGLSNQDAGTHEGGSEVPSPASEPGAK